MSKYHIEICLERFYDIEADSVEEALDIATDCAMNSNWEYIVDVIDDDEEEE